MAIKIFTENLNADVGRVCYYYVDSKRNALLNTIANKDSHRI